MKVADLFALLGLRMDAAQFKRGSDAIDRLKQGAQGLITAWLGWQGLKFAKGLVTDLVDAGGHLDDLRQKTGLSAEALQRWGHVAKLGGSDLDSLADAAGKLQMKVAEAVKDTGGPAAAAFKKLGIARDLLKTGDTEKILAKISDAFSKLPDGADKANTAVELFGKSGRDLIPTLNGGSRGMRELTRDLDVLGGTDVDALDKFGDDVDKAKAAVNGLKNQALMALLPYLQKAVDYFRAWVAANRELIKQRLAQVMQVVAKGMTAVGYAVLFVAKHWKAFALVAGAMLLALVGPFLLITAKIALVSAAVLFLAAIFQRAWQRWGGDITAAAQKMYGWAVIIRNRVDQVVGFFRDAGMAIKDAFMVAINFIGEKIEWVVDKLNQARRFAGDAVSWITQGVEGESSIMQQARNAMRDVPSTQANRTVTNNVTFNATGTDPKQVMQEFQSNFDGFLRQTALAVQ